MRSYRDLSINAKLSLLVLLAGGVALTLSTICFVLNDISMIRSSTITQMTTLAEVLGSNSTAALTFQDPDTASQLLRSLERKPSVVFACIYTASGELFASYHLRNTKFDPPRAPTMIGTDFVEGGYLDVVQHIDHDGQTIGSIYLRADMDELHAQFARYVAIVVGMIIVSMGSSVLLASRFQRLISAPILKLAEAAEQVSVQRNYGLRVVKTANDELGTLYDQFNAMLQQIQIGEQAIQRAHDELELKVVQRTAELSQANTELSRENSVRVRAEQELESTHQKLLDVARRAGMAEVATGVLHNVGNVLNSVNVSATLVSDRMRQSKVADLVRATQLIEQHRDHLGTFVTSDEKGKQLPGFLSLLAMHLSDERADIIGELDLLTAKVEHIKTIVATQQSYAGVSGVLEAVDLATTIDDALKLNTAAFDRHKITIIKHYADMPKVRIDKQKVLQILINTLKNAKEAFQECPLNLERSIVLRSAVNAEGMLQIEITDNGVGIAPEDLTRIFSHGFTTKKTGHGFGLHSCANAAAELGGVLKVRSDGPGAGATFTLEIPYQPAEVVAAP